MENRPRRLASAALVCLALAGCASPTARALQAFPDGGPVRVIHKPYKVVFSAAVRVMHLNKEAVREADPETGRILAAVLVRKPRGVFLTALPADRTRVELTSGFEGTFLFPGPKPEEFFAQLREETLAYLKRLAAESEELRKLRIAREQERARAQGIQLNQQQ